jgi:hypothetical protein
MVLIIISSVEVYSILENTTFSITKNTFQICQYFRMITFVTKYPIFAPALFLKILLMNITDLYRFLSPKFQNLFLEYKVNFKPRYGNGLPPHPELYSIINAHRDNYKTILNKALEYKELFWEIKDRKEESNVSNPAWNNGFLPGLDIIGIYTLMLRLI